MTPAQQKEMRRFTHSMWTLLRYAKKMHPSAQAQVFSTVLRTARVLERRGFVSVGSVGHGVHAVRLTEAGHEALTTCMTA